MTTLQKTWKLLSNVQILSALIWAAAILICSDLTGNKTVPMVLGTAAGLHVVLLAGKFSKEARKNTSGQTAERSGC